MIDRDALERLALYFSKKFGARRLADITWAHAVNTRSRLAAVSQLPENQAPMFLEFDVLLGAASEPVLAHNSWDAVDLSMDELVTRMSELPQGLKVDFKSLEVVEPSLQLLQRYQLHQPIILNADVIRGPGGKMPVIDARQFVEVCRELYPAGVLSLGWTTEAGDRAGYTQTHVDEMLRACEGLPPLAFPVRASYLAPSWEQLRRLEEHVGSVISLWDGKPVASPVMSFIEWRLGHGHYFFDCEVEH